MDDYNQRRLERLNRIATFGREHTADFAAGSRIPGLLGAVDTHIASVNSAKAGQRPARKSKDAFRLELAESLRDLARTARSIELDEPGFAAPYRLPDERTERNLLTHADAVLARLEVVTTDAPGRPADAPEVQAAKLALQAKFAAFDLPPGFVADLREDVDAVRDTTDENRQETQSGQENTAFIDAELARAAETVQRLDTCMRNRYARQPETIATWASVSRIHRAARPGKGGDQMPETPVPEPPLTPPAPAA